MVNACAGAGFPCVIVGKEGAVGERVDGRNGGEADTV